MCLATAVAAALVTAAPTLAGGFTLNLSVPAPVVVGKPAVIKAAGTIPLADVNEYSYWFSLDAIPASVTTICPADDFQAGQIAESTGGSVVVLTQPEHPDSTGSFTSSAGISPTAPGAMLLCGYTDDGAAQTLASASLVLHIRPAPRAKSRCRKLRGRARARCLRRVHAS